VVDETPHSDSTHPARQPGPRQPPPSSLWSRRVEFSASPHRSQCQPRPHADGRWNLQAFSSRLVRTERRRAHRAEVRGPAPFPTRGLRRAASPQARPGETPSRADAIHSAAWAAPVALRLEAHPFAPTQPATPVPCASKHPRGLRCRRNHNLRRLVPTSPSTCTALA